MVESSIPTFEAFCTHHDASILLADQLYLAEFEAVVRHYASFASTRLSPGKTQPSKPVMMRWRSSGLEAIRAVASSDALSSIAGRQYDMMVPMVLENLWTDNEDFLDVLLQRVEVEEQVDTDRLLKRRTSVATVRTADTSGDTNPIALSGTAMDVDKLAEEDIGVLAMQCLKQIFIAPSRSLIRSATTSLLEFVNERIGQGESVVCGNLNSGKDSGWSVKICSLLLRWAPVQERYIILVTTMDIMARSQLTDDTLDQHIALAAMISSLLRSDASLIGLSVMDVLLGFIQHIKKLVQMPGDPAAAAAAATSGGPLPGQMDLRSPTTLAAVHTVVTVSSKRKELLLRLQQCIGDLATHVYYADQISDMVSAILFRLKPARSGGAVSSTPPGEKADDVQESPQQSRDRTRQHHSSVDSLFSLTVTKTAILRAVKAILLVANPRTHHGGSQPLTRNRVPLQVWEGTHWLLRDADGGVRKAYVDALQTWLDRETTQKDQEAQDYGTVPTGVSMASSGNRPTTRGGREATVGPVGLASFAKRAVSSTSQRENGSNNNGNGNGNFNGVINSNSGKTRLRQTFFVSLLHLAIYDNALQFVDYESDLLLLHVLLNKLAERLGVNAVRYGLPMIFQLQESIQDVETPQAKVRLGSVVHGYFWTLTEKFNFEASVVGRAIRNEITRRRSKHFWVEGIQVPPAFLELAGTPGLSRPQPRMPLHEIESEALLPFDDRLSLVECISTGYYEALAGSPPQSPSTSPSRGIGGSGSLYPGFSVGGATEAANTYREVPTAVREDMLSDWSREAVMQQVQQQAGSKSVSLSGSRSGTMVTANTAVRSRLASNTVSGLSSGQLYYYNSGGLPSPPSLQTVRPNSQPAWAFNSSTANDMLAAPIVTRLRKSSVRSGLSPSPMGSMTSRGGGDRNGGGFVTSVDQLKLALAGTTASPDLGDGPAGQRNGDPNDDDASSDSMASYDMSASEFSFNPTLGAGASQAQPEMSGSPTGVKRSLSAAARKSSTTGDMLLAPLTFNPLHSTGAGANGDAEDDAVPPVPPLPSLLRGQQGQQAHVTTGSSGYAGLPPVTCASSDNRPTSASPGKTYSVTGAPRRNTKSRGDESVLSSLIYDELPASVGDLDSLLKGIDSRAGEHSFGNVSRPPY